MLYNWLVIQDDYSKIFGNKQKILVVFSHPDDLEVMCGGLVRGLVVLGSL
jgi:LmbE family N-acetylglucosaminyl deacetylase